MGSGMNLEQAKELASKRSYSWAVGNITTGKGIKYRKATMIKLRELAEIADRLDHFLVTELTESEYADAYNRGFASAVAMMADRKTEPKTQTETQNSNLTFEKRTMRDCYNCRKYETEGECVECKFEPKDEPQIYVINPQEPTNDDKCFECEDFFTCGGQCNKIEDEPQTCSVTGRPYDCGNCERFRCTADVPQTDCAWMKGE